MKKIGLAALTAVLMTSGSAYAADVYQQGGLKDEPGAFDSPRVVNWTGFYIGGSIGYGNANHNLTVQDYFKDFCTSTDPESPGYDGDADNHSGSTDTIGNINNGSLAAGFKPLKAFTKCEDIARNRSNLLTGTPVVSPTPAAFTSPGGSDDIANLDGVSSSGLVGDGRVGFDIARGRFLFGIFGAYGFNDMETSASIDLGGPIGIDASIEKGEEWSVGARAGVLVNPRTLAYILAAYTQAEYEFGVSGLGKSESTEVSFSGISVGGGVEFAVTNNIFLGIEGMHTFYGEETVFDDYSKVGNQGTRLIDDLDETKVMGTLKIKLNSGLPNFMD
jgi:outer membrane immunogenic protein